MNYCDKCGNCSRCGECCAAQLPITKKEEKIIKSYIREKHIEPEFFQNEKSINLQCCFYDRTNKICKIYEVRPSICRSYKCNKNKSELEKERDYRHEVVYWNGRTNNEFKNVTDMRLLFYGDPRSLIANIIYQITDGKMICNEKQFEFLKTYLRKYGQTELSDSINGEFDD